MAYDLEHCEPITDLVQYSYESLMEGYFKVDTDSFYMDSELDLFERLLCQQNLTESE